MMYGLETAVLTKKQERQLDVVTMRMPRVSLGVRRKELLGTRQVTRAMHVRDRICPRVKLIIKILIILLIIFLGFIKSKSC